MIKMSKNLDFNIKYKCNSKTKGGSKNYGDWGRIVEECGTERLTREQSEKL